MGKVIRTLLAKLNYSLFGFNAIRARYLSRKGEHAAALTICKMKDIQVLSRAGMHLSVLKFNGGPSIERALALAQVGELDAAIDMAQAYSSRQSARILFGYLAVVAPGRILKMINETSGLEGVKSYCLIETGNLSYGERAYETLSPLHGMALAIKEGNLDRARERFKTFFTKYGLKHPTVKWASCGLRYKSLSSINTESVCAPGPLVSVILTAYNEEEYLAIAVYSLLAQSWKNLELILVNDASTDGTRRIADELAKKDHRIHVIHLENNIGLWESKNIGLKFCKGDFITMHDADDWSHWKKLELQVAPLIENKRFLATTSHMVRIDEHTGFPYTRNACSYMRWNPSSFMFNSNVLKTQGKFMSNLLGSDCEFIARFETINGVSSHKRIRLPLSIGLQRRDSLSNKFRGYDDIGIRISHWESWRESHLTMLTRSDNAQCYLWREM